MQKRLLSFLAMLLLCVMANAQNPVAVTYATSKRPSQSGNDITKAYDGNLTTLYHSNYTINAIPDTVDFYFIGVKSINKIDYVPRPTQTNGVWSTVDVYYASADAPKVFVSKLSNISWAVNNTVKTIDMTANPIVKPYIVRFVIRAAWNSYSSCAEIKFSSAETGALVSTDCDNPTAEDFSNYSDVKLSVSSASVSPAAQAGEDISRTYDNNSSTLYHSNYNGGGFPISLTYNFTSNPTIDYINYIPRQDGSQNGLFGTGEIWYKTTTETTLTKLMNFDAGFGAALYQIRFPASVIGVTQIVVKVLSGKNSYATCAEMQFYQKNPNAGNLYMDIFADDLHTTLKSEVTQTDIDAMGSQFFKSLAQCIFNNTYNKKYRIQNYDFYPNQATVEGILKTNGLNRAENPTGIVFKAGTKAIVFVGETYGVNPSLMVKDFALNSPTIDNYILKTGINVLNISRDGLGYINYYSDNANLQPVAIHIATGKVNGYYDPVTDTDEEWTKMLFNGVYPVFDIKGTYVNLNLHKFMLAINSPSTGKDMIAAYDTIVHQEYIMSGLFKYNRVPKNHMFLRTLTGDGTPNAGFDGVRFYLGAGTGSAWATGKGVLGNPWGTAHEFGHNNQVRPGGKWIGMTEVTNNIYSAWFQYRYGVAYGPYSRLEKESEVPKTGLARIKGGSYSMASDVALVRNLNIQSQDDPFVKLVPFWQLEVYYQIAGAGKNLPTLQERMAGTPAPVGQLDVALWHADVMEKLRTTSQAGLNNGQLVLNFVKITCDAVQEDLTDFFVKSGYLLPIDRDIDDYGIQRLTITQAQIDATIAAIKAKGYPKPVSPVLNYISLNSVNAYKNLIPLAPTSTATVGVTVNATTLTIDNTKWANAVAFETYNQKALTDVAIYGLGDGSAGNAMTTVQFAAGSTSVYAIGYDGSRKLVYPAVDVANALPTVSITSPVSNAVITAGNNIVINADATDTDGTVNKVEFYQGSTLLGESTTAPYSFTWNNPAVGTYALTVKATDDSGGTKVSDTVKVTINALPAVAISSPGSNSIFTSGTNVAINADASDADGTVTKVEFYQGSILLGESTITPYGFTWNNPAIGTYALTTKVTDNNGGTVVSDTVRVTINALPSVVISSPSNNSVFTAGANIAFNANASDTDGTVTKVEFYQGSTLLGESTTAPYNFTWGNPSAGTYALTAKVTDNNGGTQVSDTVNVTINTLPTVAISSPGNNAVFTAGTNVAINANASDADGTVTKVEFYQGSTLLGESTTAPYSFTLINPTLGTYALTAKAIDNNGGTKVSDTVKIFVNTLPTVAITSPIDLAALTAGTNLVINASAADADGTIAKVEFYQGSTLLGQSTTSPYSFTWNNLPVGSHALTAKATDNNGGTTTSTAINVSVSAAPTVVIAAPLNNTVYTANSNITLNATTTGTIVKVEFYDASVLLGQSTGTPYSFVWNNVASGTHALTAKATDNLGRVATSSVVNVNVSAPQVLTVNPVADAFVRDGAFANVKNGSATSLDVSSDIRNFFKESYLRFDYSTYSGSVVRNAKIRIYVNHVNFIPSKTISVYGLSNITWSESTINWNNRPTEVGTMLGSYAIGNTGNTWYELDITAYINGQLALGKKIVSFRLINQGAKGLGNLVSFNSREAASNKPALLLNQEPSGANLDELPTNTDKPKNNLSSLVLKVTAWPNPSTNIFKVQVESPSNEVLKYRVYNIAQQLVKEAQVPATDLFTFGEDLPFGVYLIEVKQGGQRKVVKVIKL